MPVQIVRPRSIGVAPGGARRAILLTDASGVVGPAVLGRLQYWAARRGFGQAPAGTAQAA